MSKGQIQVAAIPFRQTDQGVEVLLITSRETRRWIVPKGWPHKGRSFADSAACEALEEAGVTGHVFRECLGGYWYEKRLGEGLLIPCEVLVYPLRVEQQHAVWREMGQRDMRWVSIVEAETMVEASLRPLFARLLDWAASEASSSAA